MSAAPRSYSTQKVAERLAVSIQTVQRWVDAGHLRAWKTLGGHRRIDADSAEQLFKAKTSARGASGAEALRVLVVDDNTDDCDILAHLVTQAVPDAQLTLADNGFGGLVSIGQWQPHVLITALVMPHMDGLGVTKHFPTQRRLPLCQSPRAHLSCPSYCIGFLHSIQRSSSRTLHRFQSLMERM